MFSSADTGFPQYPQPPITLRFLLMTSQGINISKNQAIAKMDAHTGRRMPQGMHSALPSVGKLTREGLHEAAGSLLSCCLPWWDRNHRFCGSSVSDKHSQPLGTPPHRFFLSICAARMPVGTNPLSSDSPQPPLGTRSLLLLSLDPHSSCLSHHPPLPLSSVSLFSILEDVPEVRLSSER